MRWAHWLGWDLGEEESLSLSNPATGGTLLFLVASPLLAMMVVGCIAGHVWTRLHWPWLLDFRHQVAAFLALWLALALFSVLVRRARAEFVAALGRGERGAFWAVRNRRQVYLAGLLGGLLGLFLGGRNGFPSSLALLLLMPWFALTAAEAVRALKEAARQGLEAHDQALRARLAPHFIFNTLNTLHAQIERDPRAAQATTERLAGLFRQVLEVSQRTTIPLKQELEFVEAYLGIEQVRLGDRLRVAVQVPEEVESAEVPPLALQVLVENAVKHGVAPREQGGEIAIRAERAGRDLWLWVEDPGTGGSPVQGTGTALQTLRHRLRRPQDLVMETKDGRHRAGFCWTQA